MFGHSYFGSAYFGSAYFGPGGSVAPPVTAGVPSKWAVAGVRFLTAVAFPRIRGAVWGS